MAILGQHDFTATWTSAADDGNPQNPENWACTNANGVADAAAIPGSTTIVTIPDGCTNSFPVGKGFLAMEVKLPATLGADNLDWSGITAPLSGTLDLQGKKLTVSQLMGTATITDSTNLSGELHVNVTEGTKVNTTVALTGSLKFVKEGAGTFTAAKTGQTYAGGTEVAAGKFLIGLERDEGKSGFCGPAGSTVTVDAGATLDLYGNTVFNTHPLVLAGGTVMSSGTSSTLTQSAQIGDVTLTADSTINPSQHIRCTGCVDLGTHMITITPPNGKYFSMRDGSSFKNGLVNVTAVGYIHFMDGAVRDLRTVDFLLNCGTDFTGEITVRDLEFGWTGGAKNAGIISVTRTYMPRLTTGSTRKCELRDGATLDLRYQTAAWLLEPTHLTFAKDATVTVSFGDSPVRNGQIVSWATGNDPGNSVTFVKDPTLDGYLFREATGLFYRAAFRIRVR